MRSTEKGTRKKGKKRERKEHTTWPPDLFSLRVFSKTFVLKILGKCSEKLTNSIQFTLKKYNSKTFPFFG
jgi:hypothetical protein